MSGALSLDFDLLDSTESIRFRTSSLTPETVFEQPIARAFITNVSWRELRASAKGFTQSDQKIRVAMSEFGQTPRLTDSFLIEEDTWYIISIEPSIRTASYLFIVRNFALVERLSTTFDIEEAVTVPNAVDGTPTETWSSLQTGLVGRLVPMTKESQAVVGQTKLDGMYTLYFLTPFSYSYTGGPYRINYNNTYYRVDRWENPEDVLELPYFIVRRSLET